LPHIPACVFLFNNGKEGAVNSLMPWYFSVCIIHEKRRIRNMKKMWIFLIVSVFVIMSGAAWAETEITSIPYTISTPGSYYITQDLTSTTYGIYVAVDNVTIDLRGHSLIGNSANSGGVYLWGRKNVEVKNGTIRGFVYGVYEGLTTGRSHRIINIRAIDNSGTGVSVKGAGHTIRNCTFYSNSGSGLYTGGGAVIEGNDTYDNGAHGISVGVGSTIKNNTVYQNNYYGIFLSGNSLVENNTAYDNSQAGGYANMNSCSTCTIGTNHAP
jgi:parallel beta-helix repeat protein